ncbi:MAG: TraR/DksA family transcriptional regulator [Nocardioidaceae bacterium]
MEHARAQALLDDERRRVEGLLADANLARDRDSAAQADTGNYADRAEPLVEEGLDQALATSLQQRLEALERAQQRLDNGTFGRSTLSSLPIPDERLEADPAAELTVEEAARRGSPGRPA